LWVLVIKIEETPALSHLVLRPKPNAHRMYAHEQFVIHTTGITTYQNNQCLKRVLYYKNNVLLQKTKLNTLGRSTSQHRHSRVEKTLGRIVPR
jgi:hypothetical protein